MHVMIRMRSVVSCGIAVLAAWLPLTPALADGTSPGKNSAYESSGQILSGVSNTDGEIPLVTAELEKGKRGRVLDIAATALVAPNSGPCAGFGRYQIRVAVGPPSSPTVLANPQFPTRNVCQSDGVFITCPISGNFWLDLDMHPELIDVPLEITLLYNATTPGGAFCSVRIEDAVLAVRMQNK
jgi:hypothetical protein